MHVVNYVKVNSVVNVKPLAMRSSCAGFTYIGLLLAVALLGVMLAEMATVWSQVRQRENEQQLLFIGSQFRQAIASYYERSPGAIKQYPKKLDDLVEDNRTPFISRHLRKIFHDPVTGSTDWGLIKDASNGITGIYSKSDVEPLKKANFDKVYARFEGKQHYSDWQFIYAPGTVPAAAIAQNGSATTAPAPAEIIPPEYVAPPPPLLNDSPADNRKTRLCGLTHNNDLQICLNMVKKFGDAAGKNCLASAASRNAVCLNGDVMPTLDVQYQ